MKKLDSMLKEYVGHLNVDNLKYLAERLEDRIASDLSDALNMVSSSQDLDRWLGSAKSCDEFYDMVDTLQEYVIRELGKRAPELQSA